MPTSSAVPAAGIVTRDGEALNTSSSVVAAEPVTGSHVFHIKGYSVTRSHGSGEPIKSSTFSVGGHQWCIRFYPDGNGLENAGWISIYLEHDHADDDADDVAVNARFMFGVVDESGDVVSKFSMDTPVGDTFSSRNRCWGFARFVERTDIEESPYLRDDCLKVRCEMIVSKSISTEPTRQYVRVPPSNMRLHFGALLSGEVGTDVTFNVAGEVIAAHRCVLAARSPVFMAELFGPMKEKATECIEIQDMEPGVFKAMLHFIYTDTMPDFDKGDASVMTQHLLAAADRYDLERLKLMCVDRLCNCIDTSNVATTLALAEQHGCHGLKTACFDLLKSSRHLKMVMATEGFDHIMSSYPSIIKELLGKVASCP